ncbi:FliM/FliN family flagellar motor switch protein [Meridianimarinicoccus aquatilis]|nr:FliM/FliN family flagellar motor C-terminal domain-containing protein [Fluviibacterium aquatile]
MDKTQRGMDAIAADSVNNSFSKLPIEVRVTVGRARPTIDELLSMSVDSVLTLDRSLSDPVELFVGEKLIAKGVLEELGGNGVGQLAVRLLEVANDNEQL